MDLPSGPVSYPLNGPAAASSTIAGQPDFGAPPTSPYDSGSYFSKLGQWFQTLGVPYTASQDAGKNPGFAVPIGGGQYLWFGWGGNIYTTTQPQQFNPNGNAQFVGMTNSTNLAAMFPNIFGSAANPSSSAPASDPFASIADVLSSALNGGGSAGGYGAYTGTADQSSPLAPVSGNIPTQTVTSDNAGAMSAALVVILVITLLVWYWYKHKREAAS